MLNQLIVLYVSQALMNTEPYNDSDILEDIESSYINKCGDVDVEGCTYNITERFYDSAS